MNAWTTIAGAVIEAWQELRIHRTRVLLSLIGVAVAVCSITAVVAFAGIAEEANTEQSEVAGGQPANIQINVSSQSNLQPTYAQLQPSFDSVIKRYDISYASANEQSQLDVQFATGVETVNATLVDPAFATMHVMSLAAGRWLDAADANRLAPAVVVNATTYAELGSPDLRTNPVLHLLGSPHTVAVVVGVTSGQVEPGNWGIYLLPAAFERVAGPSAGGGNSPTEELWVPPKVAGALTSQIQSDLKQDYAGRWDVSVGRVDFRAYTRGDPLLIVKLVVGGIAGLVLLLGALGLVNISMVTVRYRVREIGIRRSFGATASRVFFSVMMESVVATLVAGGIGVIAAILIVENPLTQSFVERAVVDVPPFPFSAAILGIICSVGVGALAGLLPALVAVRVKVIDAIRF